MHPHEERMVLVSAELLVLLMQRDGDGSAVSVRDLADAVGCHPSKIDGLRTGRRKTSLYSEAVAIAKRLGVDLLVLWRHAGRTVDMPDEASHMTAVPA